MLENWITREKKYVEFSNPTLIENTKFLFRWEYEMLNVTHWNDWKASWQNFNIITLLSMTSKNLPDPQKSNLIFELIQINSG